MMSPCLNPEADLLAIGYESKRRLASLNREVRIDLEMEKFFFELTSNRLELAMQSSCLA